MPAIRGRRLMTMILASGTVLGAACLIPWAAAAEASERAMKWQMSIPITFTSGSSYDSEEGTSIDVNDDLGWGVGFGYHLNQRFMVGADFTWLSANYDAHVATDFDGDQVPDDSVDISGTLDAANFQLVGQYNILPGRITPFVRGSLGWTWVDSNIPSGPTQGVCWWDHGGAMCATPGSPPSRTRRSPMAWPPASARKWPASSFSREATTCSGSTSTRREPRTSTASARPLAGRFERRGRRRTRRRPRSSPLSARWPQAC